MTGGLVAGALGLGAAAFIGGWPWALLCALMLAALWRFNPGSKPVVAALGVSVLWLALFYWTGDRRLFFPYAMQLATQMPFLLRGPRIFRVVMGGGGMVGCFLLIRIVQGATADVLAVEMVVAIAILAVVFTVYRLDETAGGQDVGDRVIAGTLASLLAFAGLALN